MDGQTKLSRYIWEKRDEGLNPTWQWRILESNVKDFNPVPGTCRLCTREKYRIIREPSSAMLNHRTELFAFCKHKQAYLLRGIHQIRFLFPFGREDSVVMYSMLFCNLSPDDWLARHETLCSDVRVNLTSKYIITFPASFLLCMLLHSQKF